MSEARVHADLSGGIARITLARPPLNILTTQMLDELCVALEGAAASPTAKVALLEGTGRAFCAGVDVGDHTAERVEAMVDAFHRAIVLLGRLDLPVIAAVHGAALGGGCEIALACDIVVASEDAHMGLPEIRLGVFPPAAAALLPRLIGRQRALEMILTGRTVRAREAQALGLVTRVFGPTGFHEEVAAFAGRIAEFSGPVLRVAKRAVARALDRPLEEAMQAADTLYLRDLMALRDPHEGLAAFLEKRDPIWMDA